MAYLMNTVIKPGLFGSTVAADTRRDIYDAYNEQLLAQEASIDVVFIGDSITETWVLDAYFQSLHGLIINRGIGGDSTPYMRRRFSADVLQLRPRLVVILAGINNFWELDDWNAERVRALQVIEDEIVNDCAEMVKMAREQQIDAAVCSILPTNILANSNTARRNLAIKHVNEMLRRGAIEWGATFVDYHQHFTAEDTLTLRDGLAADGLHPGAVGYKIMADVLLKSLTHDEQDGVLHYSFKKQERL